MSNIKTEYHGATGSMTGTFITVERWTVPVYPTNDGELYYVEDDKTVIVEE